MNKELFSRSIGLLGEGNFAKLQDKTIAIFGLGGVGGTALEALARTGFNHFILVDFDEVEISNLNRQILFTSKDIGKKKVVAAKERILSINQDADIQIFCLKAQEFNFDQKIDFAVDAIDNVDGKLYILKNAQERSIPSIMSLGMARRFEPGLVKVAKLNQTNNDPLAKKIRYLVKKSGLETSNVPVVISMELPKKSGEKLYSTMMVPSSAGLTIAKYILETIIK